MSDLDQLHYVVDWQTAGWTGHISPLLHLRVLVRSPAPSSICLPLSLALQHLLPRHLLQRSPGDLCRAGLQPPHRDPPTRSSRPLPPGCTRPGPLCSPHCCQENIQNYQYQVGFPQLSSDIILNVSLSWEENYGDHQQRIFSCDHLGLNTVTTQRNVLVLGLVQTSAESAMYIFVFLWTPVLLSTSSDLPLGLVFSTFMVCIMAGSQVSSWLYLAGVSHLVIVRRCLFIMAVSLTLASLSANISVTTSFFSFLVLELAIGLSNTNNTYHILSKYLLLFCSTTLEPLVSGCYFPAISSLRSEMIPEHCRAAVLSWYRLPLNLITCVTLISLNLSVQRETLLLLAGHLCLGGALLSYRCGSPARQKSIIL